MRQVILLTETYFDVGRGREHKHQQNGQQTSFVHVGRFVLEAAMTAATQLTRGERVYKKDRVFSLLEMQATGSVEVQSNS